MLRISTLTKNLITQRSFSTLVVADHAGDSLAESTKKVIAAAKLVGKPIDVLVAGSNVSAVAQQAAKLDSVSKVLIADDAALAKATAEDFSALVAGIQNDKKYTHILSSTSSFNKNWVPRCAAGFDVQPIGDVIKVVSEDTFVRPVYAGNALATVQSKDAVKFATIRASSFDSVSASGSASTDTVTPTLANGPKPTVVSEQIVKSDRPELGAARVVVSGGRGLKSSENFAMLNELADVVGGAVGASRAAVDAGFVGNDLQVGQTGKIVAPEFYFAVGISGAIQHLAGMKDSKTIIAINKDADAPIFQVADYGVVGDLFEVVPEITKKLQAVKK